MTELSIPRERMLKDLCELFEADDLARMEAWLSQPPVEGPSAARELLEAASWSKATAGSLFGFVARAERCGLLEAAIMTARWPWAKALLAAGARASAETLRHGYVRSLADGRHALALSFAILLPDPWNDELSRNAMAQACARHGAFAALSHICQALAKADPATLDMDAAAALRQARQISQERIDSTHSAADHACIEAIDIALSLL